MKEEINFDDIEFGEPIEEKEPTYRDGYIRGIYRAKNIIDSKQKEIERLNNIIENAKIYCEGVIQEHENGEYDVDTVWLAIKEHKGNIKSVLNILNGDLENYWRGDKK